MLLSLPLELHMNIMLRLPIKTLVICACTSKTLLNLLLGPDFVGAHIKKSKESPFILLRYYVDVKDESRLGRTKEYFAVHPDDGFSDSKMSIKDMPIDDRANSCFTIVGSCNGVICLSDDCQTFSNVVYLWNPSIRKFIELPCPNVTYSTHGPFDMCVGFGFDQVMNDYKVVRLVYLEESGFYPAKLPPEVEVYSVKSGSWRYIEGPGPLHFTRVPGRCYSQCFLNGLVHWPGYKMEDTRGEIWSVIVTFNVQDECFGEMKLSICLEGARARSNELKMITCWDMLGLIQMSRSEESLVIWVMREYGNVDSWTPHFKCDHLGRNFIPKAFYYRKNKDVLMLAKVLGLEYNAYHLMWSIDWVRNQTEELETLEGKLKGFHLGSYEEGLALFNEGKSHLLHEAVEETLGDEFEAPGETL